MPKPPTIDELEAILNSDEAGPAIQIRPDGTVLVDEEARTVSWPDPTPEMFGDPKFNAIWNCIKEWDISVPGAYTGYCGATGNHVRAIFDVLAAIKVSPASALLAKAAEQGIVGTVRTQVETSQGIGEETCTEVGLGVDADAHVKIPAELTARVFDVLKLRDEILRSAYAKANVAPTAAMKADALRLAIKVMQATPQEANHAAP